MKSFLAGFVFLSSLHASAGLNAPDSGYFGEWRGVAAVYKKNPNGESAAAVERVECALYSMTVSSISPNQASLTGTCLAPDLEPSLRASFEFQATVTLDLAGTFSNQCCFDSDQRSWTRAALKAGEPMRLQFEFHAWDGEDPEDGHGLVATNLQKKESPSQLPGPPKH